MSRDRWYGRMTTATPRGVVQVESTMRRYERSRDRPTLPEHVLRLAHTEYEHQYGHTQDYERMQERGGLGLLEVIGLLADYVDRLGGLPTRPRAVSSPGGNSDA